MKFFLCALLFVLTWTASAVADSLQNPYRIAALSVTPDPFKLPSDGADDAPSINRALAYMAAHGQTQMDLLPRHYAINSQVLQSNITVRWQGRGWQEPNGGSGTATPGSGTWFVIGSSFAGSSANPNPFLVQGQSAGSSFENLGFYETQPAPAVGWTPTIYPEALHLENINGGVTLHNIMMLAVFSGVQAHIVPHLTIDGLWGQVFQSLLVADKNYDIIRIQNVHSWPFWTQDVNVLSYQQQYLNSLVLGRCDTVMLDQAFGFAQNSLVQLTGTATEGPSAPGGTTTKLQVGTINADSTRYGLWITSLASGATFQIASFTDQGQTFDNNPTVATPLTGAVAIEIDGSASGTVGDLSTEITALETIAINNAAPSFLTIHSQKTSLRWSPSSSVIANMTSATGTPHQIVYGTPVQVIEATGKTWQFKNTGTTGIVYQPTETSATP